MPHIVSNRGSIKFIGTLNKKKIAIIKGGRSYNDELRETIENIAKETDAKIQYIASIKNEPYIEDVCECMDRIREFEPDMILAIGGGSVLDTAKAIHLFYENPDISFEAATIPFSLPKLGKKAIHVSVPTTSGTGSEATSVAVFIDRQTKTKKLLLDNNLIPHYAILDADLTNSLPSTIALNTGMDALTHAIESATAKNASVMSKAFSLESAIMILENIKSAVLDETPLDEKLKAREIIHNASAIAGVAITNSCTGIAHSYDHPGPQYDLPHGAVCGLMLPYTMMICAEQEAYKILAKRMGINSDKVENLVKYLIDLMKSMNMKTTFKEYGIDENEYFANADIWSKISLEAFATVMSPADMTEEKGKELYTLCYYGIT